MIRVVFGLFHKHGADPNVFGDLGQPGEVANVKRGVGLAQTRVELAEWEQRFDQHEHVSRIIPKRYATPTPRNDTNVASGRREIDATGMLLTPGFVDIHTHYDSQATWDGELEPSTPHGVTTLMMGNCGVDFAPAKPDEHDFLIDLTEGFQDVPGAALSEGISCDWETFTDYLDVLERREYVADIGAMIAHGPVRVYVMGQRGANNEAATSDDTDEMAAIVGETVDAGAIGFSTTRTTAKS